METIVAALIAAAASVAVTLITVSIQNTKSQAIMLERIDHLSNEVEKHNSVVERTFRVEQDMANLFHRYEEVKQVADDAHEKAVHACERSDAAHNRIDRAGVDNRG